MTYFNHACAAVSLVWLLALVFFGLITAYPTLLPPCPTEDSQNCHWDATSQGNGQGRSFVDVLGWAIMDPAAATMMVEVD